MDLFREKSIKAKKQAKTYVMARVCLYCGAPIEDQARASKLYCSVWIDKYGVRHDCKRKQHQVKHENADAILLDFNSKQREISRQITRMLKTHGDEVATEVLDAYGINLFDCLKIEMNKKEGEASFLRYKIITNAKTFKHKIIKA